jgi:hypothetical protein
MMWKWEFNVGRRKGSSEQRGKRGIRWDGNTAQIVHALFKTSRIGQISFGFSSEKNEAFYNIIFRHMLLVC